MQYFVQDGGVEISVMAEENGMSPGCASMNPYHGKETIEELGLENVWWISRVVVKPEHRRKGIGTRLVRHMLAHADIPVMVAYGGYDITPEEQVAFYKSLGFVECVLKDALLWTPPKKEKENN